MFDMASDNREYNETICDSGLAGCMIRCVIYGWMMCDCMTECMYVCMTVCMTVCV